MTVDVDNDVFRQVLGQDFDRLPACLRRAHGGSHVVLSGTSRVRVYLGWLGRAVCWGVGLPAAGDDVPVAIIFSSLPDGRAYWDRRFAARRYRSVLFVTRQGGQNWLTERWGVIGVLFDCRIDADRLRLEVMKCRLFGITLPRFLLPGCLAFESDQGGSLQFDIVMTLPFLGRLIAYSGVVRE